MLSRLLLAACALQTANAGLYLVYNEIDDETVVGPIEKRREFVIKYSRIFDLL